MSIINTTYRQLSLMFGMLLLTNAIVIILVFRHYSILPAGQQMGNFISQQIILLEPLLSGQSILDKQSTITELYPKGEITISTSLPESELPSLRFYKSIRETLKQKKYTQIKHQSIANKTIIWVKSLDTQANYWFGFAFEPFMNKALEMMRIIFIVLLGISLFAAYAFSRYSLRPLQQLAVIAKEQSKDPDYLPGISLKGTKEVREVAKLVQRTISKHQQLAEDKETFLAGVSHDLRTPLTRIRFQLEWINNEDIKSDIVLELDEMNQIIDDFMIFAKDPSTLPAPTGISVSNLINYVVERYDTEQYAIQFNIDDPNSILAVHDSHIKRVLMNLIDNAIHHGQPPIVISYSQNKKIGLITVRDYGTGLNDVQVSKSAHRGYGFGLKTVKRLLKMNGIEYKIDSESTNGLCFYMKIPLVC